MVTVLKNKDGNLFILKYAFIARIHQGKEKHIKVKRVCGLFLNFKLNFTREIITFFCSKSISCLRIASNEVIEYIQILKTMSL